MTQGQSPPHSYSHADPGAFSGDEEFSLPPADGYFNGNDNAAPSTVMVPDLAAQSRGSGGGDSKAADMARERRYDSDPSSPLESSFPYTPATTDSPASSPRQGSNGTYAGSAGRHHDHEKKIPVAPTVLEEPPPLYDDAVSQGTPSSASGGSAPSPPTGYRPMNVREPFPPFQARAFGHQDPPQSGADQPLLLDIDGNSHEDLDDKGLAPAQPGPPKRRGCAGRKQTQRQGGRCGGWRRGHEGRPARRIRLFWLLLIPVLALWLVIFSVAKWRGHCSKGRIPSPPTDAPPYDTVFPTHPSRQIIRKETSHSITGSFPLYDLLDLSTRSGSISITVIPHPVAPGAHPNTPAVLRLSASSGSVLVRIDDKYLKGLGKHGHGDGGARERVFETYIRTKSGSVTGKILQSAGGRTQIQARSGSVFVDVIPVNLGPTSNESTIETVTSSGSTNLRLLSPPLDATAGGETITNLTAIHRSDGSGSLHISYPSEWEGSVHALSKGRGSVSVRGDGLLVAGPGIREKTARRGNGGKVEVLTKGSGSIYFKC